MYCVRTTLILICLLVNICVYGQKKDKKIIQTIAIDSTIRSVDIKQANAAYGEQVYEIIAWEGQSIVIESNINPAAAPVVESSPDDYMPLIRRKSHQISIELDNAGRGKAWVGGIEIDIRLNYKILMPQRLKHQITNSKIQHLNNK